MSEAPAQHSQPQTDPRLALGRLLREAREAKGLSLEAVASALKIRKEFLQALEAGEWGRIGESVYAHGFARAYARFLGVDAEAYLALLRPPKPELELPLVYADGPTAPSRKIGYAAGALVLALLVGAWWWSARTPEKRPATADPEVMIPKRSEAGQVPWPLAEPYSASEPTEPSPSTTETRAEMAAAPSPAETSGTPAETTSIQDARRRIVVRAVGDKLWVQWRAADGKPLKEAMLQPGEQAAWEGKASRVEVVVGNAAAAEIEVDGKVVAPAGSLGPAGKVRKVAIELPLRKGQPAHAVRKGGSP